MSKLVEPKKSTKPPMRTESVDALTDKSSPRAKAHPYGGRPQNGKKQKLRKRTRKKLKAYHK